MSKRLLNASGQCNWPSPWLSDCGLPLNTVPILLFLCASLSNTMTVCLKQEVRTESKRAAVSHIVSFLRPCIRTKKEKRKPWDLYLREETKYITCRIASASPYFHTIIEVLITSYWTWKFLTSCLFRRLSLWCMRNWNWRPPDTIALLELRKHLERWQEGFLWCWGMCKKGCINKIL